MGNTADRHKYVNPFDGGHFKNLGLYEMVLPCCHFIVVSNAGEDPDCFFADLGEAIRKIHIDFGIPIEFDQMNIYPRSQIDGLNTAGNKVLSCAVARTHYSAVDADVNGEKEPDAIFIA